jgi:hypothetical protein
MLCRDELLSGKNILDSELKLHKVAGPSG